jgi:dehydrodolichyl diphosphate syntase complex subunit NUS1
MPSLHAIVKSKLTTYFTLDHLPYLRVVAPNHPAYSPSPSPSPSRDPKSAPSKPVRTNLTLLLLSSTDGRETLVDLTKTLVEMSQQKKITPRDITTELIDAEISESTNPYPNGNGSTHLSTDPVKLSGVGNGEPDLLIIFGPYVKLDGYPPWQIRLTEIFCVGDVGADGGRVEYQGFLRGLWRFARSEMRFGR